MPPPTGAEPAATLVSHNGAMAPACSAPAGAHFVAMGHHLVAPRFKSAI